MSQGGLMWFLIAIHMIQLHVDWLLLDITTVLYRQLSIVAQIFQFFILFFYIYIGHARAQ